ncbi:MAG: Fis family transcriptional regulator, partial [candidate division Zixibacteria bacterium]|nr:Fis family transcriptional regulator [candidate division Zixibacteria bacterium]
SFQDIITKSKSLLEIFGILPDLAESDTTVLITGETGTGKELFATALHNLSPRKKRPLVKVNCGALPETLLESELFGYKRGAFTDAKQDKPGRFKMAEGGTIFLDEIGD